MGYIKMGRAIVKNERLHHSSGRLQPFQQPWPHTYTTRAEDWWLTNELLSWTPKRQALPVNASSHSLG